MKENQKEKANPHSEGLQRKTIMTFNCYGVAYFL